jgi:hypothetical protein
MTPQEMTESELIHAEFVRRFSSWDIPVDSLDEMLSKMTHEVRQAHYLELKEILEKPAFKRELDEWKRRVSRTLAIGFNEHLGRELTEIEKQGLRIMMLEIENWMNILTKRATLLNSVKPLKPTASKI